MLGSSLLFVLLAAPVEMPRVVDDRLQLELILQEPDVRTPTGLAVDAKGRVLVIESHTHFRPDGYQGPPHDRILLIDPTQKPAKPTVFFEGTKYTMNLACAPDGSIYVATRSEIFRLRDTNDDGKSDERTEIAHLETAGNYPHNGLSGFAFRHDDLYFGFGENLGADYKLVCSDGSSLSGGGEGGNIYTCKVGGLGGRNLRRVATGFWNPFHLTFDEHGKLFTVDNDPDSRPPCRLIHVVEGGDYGFKFRHGRKGTHPFTAWNGELPGTLPMICGTGEAPCAVVHGREVLLPDVNLDDLFVTSWGDHRIERYRLVARGKSYTSSMEPVVIGGENFRPTGMAAAPDGSLYFADWVDKSYPLHGKGRVWRLSARKPAKVYVCRVPVADERSWPERWSELQSKGSTDSFAWHALSMELARSLRDRPDFDAVAATAWLAEHTRPTSPDSTIWAAVAAREANPANVKVLAPILLKHDDPRVRLLGVMWVGDEGLTELRSEVEAGLARPGLTRELFEGSLAALEMLDAAKAATQPGEKKPAKQVSGEDYVVKILKDSTSPPALRRFALKALRPDHPELNLDLLQKLAGAKDDPAMRIEAIRTLRERPQAERTSLLQQMATDAKRPPAERIEALLGLDPANPLEVTVIHYLSVENSAVAAAARLETMRHERSRQPLSTPITANPTETVNQRIAQLGDGGDPAAGERLFFHPRVASCFRCHEHGGRGAAIGPSLTAFGRYTTRERILQSILDPGREMAPQFVPWTITTTDGLTKTGVYVGEEVKGEHRYADVHGNIFLVHPRDMESREAAKMSIMPADFGHRLTDDDLRNLAAFLQR